MVIRVLVYLLLASCMVLFVLAGEFWLPLAVAALVAVPFFVLHSHARRPRWTRRLGFPAAPATHHQRTKIFVVVLVNFGLFLVGLPTYHGALERYGEEIFALLMPYGSASEGSRRHTAVVLFRDQDLDGEKWPVRYGTHQRILEQIRLARPRALMIDLLFVDRRPDPTLSLLAREFETYKEAGIPVFLAESVHPGDEVLSDLRPHVEQLVAVPRFVDEARHNLYPFYRCVEATPDRTHCVTWHSTAAAALYGALCPKGGRDLCGGPPLTIDTKLHNEVMTLIWGRKILADPWTAAAFPCDSSARFWNLECPFTPTVSATQITKEPAAAAPLIRDRVVFYGAHVSANYDLTRPPVQVPLPGVYAHAMAFDNLLTYGGHYKREARAFLSHPHVSLVHVIHLLIVLTVPMAFLLPALDWLRSHPGAKAAAAAGVVCATLSTIYVLAIAVYEFRHLNIVPAHWIASLLEVAIGAFAVEFLTPSLEKSAADAHGESRSDRA
jgi:CHASE2 domain-containing sensor protein